MTPSCALWIQNVLLLANAILVWRYVRETMRIRAASEEQTRKSQLLVEAAQRQVESQTLPAIVVQELPPSGVRLVNIGNGPAMGLEWRLRSLGTMPTFSESTEPAGAVSYIEHSQPGGSPLQQAALVTKELHCLYRSLSGRRYISVSKFTANGVFETFFHSEQ